MGRVFRSFAFVVWVAVLLAGTPASSQSLVSLQGKVTDPGGAAIPNATLHLTKTADNSDQTAASDQFGAYLFTNLALGKYRLHVEARGFEEFEESDFELAGNAPKTIDVRLQIRQVQQAVTVRGQEGDECLAPQTRVLPDVGPGLRALRTGPSGNYYVLTAPGTTAAIYSPDGKPLGQVPRSGTSSLGSSIVNGADLQVDPTGRVYVADLGANAIKIYSGEGTLEKTIRVPAPVSVEPLLGGEVAVASLFSKHLADIYDEERGELYRSIGETEQPVLVECDQSSLSCTMATKKSPPVGSRIWFYGDTAGNLFISLVDSPSPTIRKYDGYGYLVFESTVPLVHTASASNKSGWNINPGARLADVGTIGLANGGSPSRPTSATSPNSASSSGPSSTDGPMSGGLAVPGGAGGGDGMQFGLSLTQRATPPEAKPKIEAMGVDPASEEMWAVLGGELIHFDKEGSLAGYYCLSTADRIPVKPTTIVVERNRILIGSDPFGIFQYPRPDKPAPEAATSH